jgi:Helix-turn-helix domain/RodZ C-terminal domain
MDDGVGKTLRDARNRRKIDLAQVEASTKIRARFLRALENEEWDVLPGETYARGFIRTYADYLGLDGARLAEDHRREVGASRPGERLPRVDPTPIPAKGPRRGRRIPPRALAALVSLALVAVLVAIGLSGGSGGNSGMPEHHRHRGAHQGGGGAGRQAARTQQGLSLRLAATAEVWVCLLDATGEPLLDGQILAGGAEAGPFRSGSFTVSLGNGEVSMTVNGQQASIPPTSSPVGYSIGAGGAIHELSEGERPTCT